MKLKICAKIRFGHFFVFLALSSICRPVHLFNTSCGLKVLIKKGLLIKNLFKEKSGGTAVYFNFWHENLCMERPSKQNSD